MPNVVVYTTEPCPYCGSAKALLKARDIEFEEVAMARDPKARAELMERTGMLTFPQILINDKPLGGFDQLAEADRNGKLKDLLSADS